MSEPLVNACSKTITLQFKVGRTFEGAFEGAKPEEPVPYDEDGDTLHGRPYTVVKADRLWHRPASHRDVEEQDQHLLRLRFAARVNKGDS